MHRSGMVAPEPHALRGFPFGLTDIKTVAACGTTPVDALTFVAIAVGPELPETLALTDPAAAMHALRDRRCDPLGGNQQRWQRRGERFAVRGGNRPQFAAGRFSTVAVTSASLRLAAAWRSLRLTARKGDR